MTGKADEIRDVSDLILSPAFRELSRDMDVWCPFEALGTARRELAHSNFLADILNPAGPHGFGDACLHAFLAAVIGDDDAEISRLELHLGDLGGADIRREWRNIDLLIRLPGLGVGSGEGLLIVVEIKVEAGEHGEQLRKYRETVEKAFPGWTHRFVFLTPAGEAPSEKHGAGWVPLDLGTVVNALEPIAQGDVGAEQARAMLSAYVAMIRRRYVEDERLEEIARQLWAYHRALQSLMHEREGAHT